MEAGHLIFRVYQVTCFYNFNTGLYKWIRREVLWKGGCCKMHYTLKKTEKGTENKKCPWGYVLKFE